MRRYETFVIIDPELSQDQRDQVTQRVDELIGQMDGFLVFTDIWGERKLAYNIKKRARGYYVRFDYCGLSPLVNEIERFFRIDDRALKYMTVLLDDAVDLDKIKEEKAQAESKAQVEEQPKEASLEVEPAPLEAPRKAEAAPAEASPEVKAAPQEALPVEASPEVKAAPQEPLPVEASPKVEAAPQDASPVEASPEVEASEAAAPVEENKPADVAPASDASDSAADTTPLKNPEEA